MLQQTLVSALSRRTFGQCGFCVQIGIAAMQVSRRRTDTVLTERGLFSSARVIINLGKGMFLEAR